MQVEAALQPITGEELAKGTNQAPDACLDVHYRGFWERQRAAFLDIRVVIPMRGMADECRRYHSRLAELLSAKKQESYATAISSVKDRDLEIEKGQAGLP